LSLSVFARIRRSFLRWADAQDIPATLAAIDPKGWVGITGVVLVLVGVSSGVPGTRDFFQLRPRPALVSFLPALTLALGAALVRGRRRTFRPDDWLVVLLGLTTVQFFAASLITWSEMPGAAVYSSLFLFTAGYHGHLHRATLREPFLPVGTLVASVVAALLRPDVAHLVVFSVVIPAALAVELLAGTYAVRQGRDRAEATRLREAVAAQMLEQQDREVRRLAQTLVEVLGHNHDMNNAVMSAMLASDELAEMAAGEMGLTRELLKPVIADLKDSLDRVQSMVHQVRAAGVPTAQPTDAERVQVGPVLVSVVSAVGARFPSARIQAPEDGTHGLHVPMRGGALSLHRVLHNLVLNACEGNGSRFATAVTVSVQRNVSGAAIGICVDDDGPGFSPDLLQSPIEGFISSKRHGTGLGLYTTERLVRASGGSLERTNRPEGGARVRVTLPLEAA
jgi:two-component system C4-dicarboxylate transport sensor histidine kinase DctB